MSDGMDFTPWIEHDGTKPTSWPSARQWPTCEVRYRADDDSLISPAVGKGLTPDHPGFLWRWRTVRTGWFSKSQRRVCDDPAYAPILSYRFTRPRQRSAAADRLAQIATNPSQPITGPEGPVRTRAPQHGGQK